MPLKTFLQEIGTALNPDRYYDISNYTNKQAIKYFTKVLILALFVMLLLFIPKIVRLPSQISQEVEKLDELDFEKCIRGGTLIKIPDRNPLIVIDPSNDPKMISGEKILLTKQSFTYRIFKEQNSISLSDKAGIGKFLGGLALFLLPSLIFFAFAVFWIKYFILILLLATILFFLLDLTHWRLKWKQVFNAVAYASTIAILLEVVSIAFSTGYLIPILDLALIKLYLVGLIVLAACGIIGTAYVHISSK